MEVSKAEDNSLNKREEGKGGFRACMFVFVLVALDNMGFIANMVSLVLYFLKVMYFDIPNSANTLTNLMGSIFLLTLLGGFISDTFLNKLYTVLLFAVIEILAMVLMTIQAHAKSLHPPYCGKPKCVEGKIEFTLYASLALLALGSGGVRGALPSLGADQFNQNDPEEAKDLATYFNWMTLSTVLGAAVGVTGIVWVSVNDAWYKGFMISTIAAFVGFIVLACGKRYYHLKEPGESPLIRIVQVFVVAIKNRKLSLPENPEELYEISDEERIYSDEKIAHTDQFRFLDRAAILPKDLTAAPWQVCTVTQVEEVKILTRMMPILFSTIIMNTCLAQLQTFSVEQGYIMNRFIGKFEVPAPSVPIIPLVFMVILIPMYEFFFVPFARKISGHPSGITQLQRVGIGLVLSAISMAVAGIVEVKRRDQAHKDLAHPISVFWLSFQYGIFGIADMFTLVGLLEFFYKEAPSGMKSLSTSFTWLSLSFGYFLSTVLVNLINAITKRVTPSKQGWLHGDDINSNNLNLFYWFLAILSCINFGVYLCMASWYKYKADDIDLKMESKGSTDGLLPAKVASNPESSVVKKEEVEESTVEKVMSDTSYAEAQAPSSEQPKDDEEKEQTYHSEKPKDDEEKEQIHQQETQSSN
ncbi:protein NRT1/ PTR FAMILY 4.5 [Ricinus communis]|uniref:Nitrate transporter, putative n=1 Tax=Ricinus communis TaxID=3988 RepID=B9RFS2_RICCO|nr:protein NRT1/ PTR FAMILY 4.5 [Ricinus communis]EEF50043.1 nitrate transporter, putative [Ricinus communis]